MEDESLKSSLSTQTTLISQSSSQSPLTQADDCYSSTSTSRYQAGGNYINRSSRSRIYCRTNHNTRKSRPSDESSNRQRTCSQCLSPRKRKGGDHDLKGILQRLSEMDVRQEQLFTMLQRTYNNGTESPISPYARSPADRFQPSFDMSSSSSLQKYIQTTLHPDPVQLCDTFLARYNLPYLLSRSYDPIELIHMHGWEQEGYGDVTLVLEDPRHEALPGVEVPWKHIDQTGEPRIALKVSRLASQIKEHWLYQGRSVRNSNDAGVPFETDEFAHTILFLNCPGYTNIMLYQSGYDSSGAHFAREPWLSGKRSLLCQLQVVLTYAPRIGIGLTRHGSPMTMGCV
ncbi:hypothetical protein F5Y04DRAFT_180587 [Hypomontagnella monticulosa]|nr:hypothetical protein F5Y04DRAFT_180587 [Hypomontagnella monticulosa]